jgi:TonB-linked SusC/RagA family outer membrane protein
MKKMYCELISGGCNIWKSKFLRKMRIVTLLLLVSITQTFALESYAQTKQLSLNLRNETILNILNKIEDQSEFYFMYDATIVDVNQRKSISCENQPITTILDQLLKDTKIVYEISNRQIVLTSAQKTAVGQQKAVSGKVTDSSGASLPGVTVVVKGTTSGTITGVDGSYSFANIPSDAVLQFSFVGMKTQETTVSGKSTINIVMQEETVGIEEVVAIGYGTVKKSDLTGAVASIKPENANFSANTSVMQAIQGSVPGLNIGATTKAGEDPSLLIRGQNSLSAGQTPLIVLDGVIFSGSISTINPGDIEQIDVLKDASSAAVYGSRSANGVIIITTKKGTTEKPTFNFNAYTGVQQVSHKIQMAGGEKYIQKILDYREAIGLEHDPANIEKYLQTLEVENYRNNTTIDWFDLVTRTAPISQYELSVSGKTKRTNYFLSGAYTKQQGIIIGDDFKRTTVRANFSNDITDWLTIGMNAMYSFRDFSGASLLFSGSYFLAATYGSPYATLYANKETGELNFYPQTDQIIINPLLNRNIIDEETNDDFVGTFYTDIKIPGIKGLKLHVDYTSKLWFYKHNYFQGSNTDEGSKAPNGIATKVDSENRVWSINNILSYTRQFNDHAIDATLLFTREGSESWSTTNTSKNFPTQVLTWNAMELGAVKNVDTSASDSHNEGFMARLNYSFKSKYLLTATFRRDGFSGFAVGNKYANFPSASLGWVISQENFAKPVIWLNYLKLRLSYGINGNQALGSYGSLARLSTLNYVFGSQTAVGFTPSAMANNALKWEKQTSLNLGLNFAVLDNRVSGEIDVYKGATTDLLVTRSLPTTTGYSSVWTNLGRLENKGIELSINSRNISTRDFQWETKFSFSLNRNKIAELYGNDNDGDGKEDDDLSNSWFIGKSYGAIYDYTANGIYQLDDEIPTGWKAGTFRVKEMDGVEGITPDDRSIVGYSLPNYRFGIYNELKYNGLSLSFMINSIQGGGKNNYYVMGNNEAYIATLPNQLNIPADMDYWTPTNPSNKYPRLDYSAKYTPHIYEDRSFVRLQDVTIAYDFKKSILSQWGVNFLKVYLSGKNLYTWTKFTGWDPETGTKIMSGYPLSRSFVAGLNINF